MNEAAREAETRRPGASHHEAAHAVFAYHRGAPIAHVMVGEDSVCLYGIRYIQGDAESTTRVVEGILAGKYAEELAATGKPRQHIPYEQFVKGIEEGARTTPWPAGTEEDEVQAFLILVTSLGRQKAEEAYREASDYAAEHVELWWGEIDALAKRLLELGRVEGSEVRRIIETARGSKDDRV
jgi:hypothetical protein